MTTTKTEILSKIINAFHQKRVSPAFCKQVVRNMKILQFEQDMTTRMHYAHLSHKVSSQLLQ